MKNTATGVVQASFSIWWSVCAAGGIALSIMFASSLLADEIKALGFGRVEAAYYFSMLSASFAILCLSSKARQGWRFTLAFLVVPFMMIGGGLSRSASVPQEPSNQALPDIGMVLAAGMNGLVYFVPLCVTILLLCKAWGSDQRK